MSVSIDSNLRIRCRLFLAIAVCGMAGCWQEIHYTPTAADSSAARQESPAQTANEPVPPTVADSPAPARSSQPPEPSAPSAAFDTSDKAAEDFANDVVAKLADERPAQPTPPPAMTAASPTAMTTAAQAPPASTAAPPSTPEPTAPSADDAAHSSRRIAWLLGSKLSLAALTNDRGDTPDETAKLFSQSRTLAEMLSTTVADLPPIAPPNSPRPNFDRSLEYLFAQGQQIGRVLANQYGNDHAALLELAVKSNILLALYRPRARSIEALSTAIEQAGGRSGLPTKLWQPLMDAITGNVPAEELRQVVYRMHSDTDRYLSTPH
jgi:hypothetical protein